MSDVQTYGKYMEVSCSNCGELGRLATSEIRGKRDGILVFSCSVCEKEPEEKQNAN